MQSHFKLKGELPKLPTIPTQTFQALLQADKKAENYKTVIIHNTSGNGIQTSFIVLRFSSGIFFQNKDDIICFLEETLPNYFNDLNIKTYDPNNKPIIRRLIIPQNSSSYLKTTEDAYKMLEAPKKDGDIDTITDLTRQNLYKDTTRCLAKIPEAAGVFQIYPNAPKGCDAYLIIDYKNMLFNEVTSYRRSRTNNKNKNKRKQRTSQLSNPTNTCLEEASSLGISALFGEAKEKQRPTVVQPKPILAQNSLAKTNPATKALPVTTINDGKHRSAFAKFNRTANLSIEQKDTQDNPQVQPSLRRRIEYYSPLPNTLPTPTPRNQPYFSFYHTVSSNNSRQRENSRFKPNKKL